MSRVLELLHWSPVAEHGGQLRGPCPVHASSAPQSRSFSVNVEKHTFQCFGCKACGNQLDLYSAVTRLPLYEAALDLCQRLGIEAPRKPRG
jgi:DNA primase